MQDYLSDILNRLSLEGTLYFRTSFTEPWGVCVPSYENVARFHYVHKGDCIVSVKGTDKRVHLSQGDLILVPHGASHTLTCRMTEPNDALELDEVLAQTGYDGTGPLVFGGMEPAHDSQLICGHFSIAPGSKHVLFERLPPLIHIRGYGADVGDWLETTLRVIGSEAGNDTLGGDIIALKVSEAIFAQAIRRCIQLSSDQDNTLSGFADPNISRALNAFHKDPTHQWTIESLAQESALSRTSFACRFSEKLGLTPMRYVTSWRIQLARNALLTNNASVAEAASHAGYSSEAAFSRVFKKEMGVSPAKYREGNQ
ncbi:MAG: AraC family transcriptional regulator [Pseudomonadota bacterium]